MLNKFGTDFMAAGMVWTRDLCLKDSDGDDYTNGEELGDPCCYFAVGQQLSTPAVGQLSHPGFGNSTPTQPVRAVTACTGPAPPAAPPAQYFQPGETQRAVEYRVNVTLAAQETNYWNIPLALPLDETYHIVGFHVILDKAPYVHHYLVYSCPNPISPSASVSGPTAYTMPRECNEENLLWGWAPGSIFYASPTNAGFLAGANTTRKSLILQLHYTNPQALANVVDTSGFGMYYTPTLRQYNMGVMWTGSVTNLYPIAPGRQNHYDTWACVVSAPAGVTLNVLAYQTHAHLLGNRIWSDKVQVVNNVRTKVGELGRDDNWRFDDQYVASFPSPKALQNGDMVYTTCVYNSTGRAFITTGGPQTNNEMCINFLYFFPSTGAEICTVDKRAAGELPQGATSGLQLVDLASSQSWFSTWFGGTGVTGGTPPPGAQPGGGANAAPGAAASGAAASQRPASATARGVVLLAAAAAALGVAPRRA